MSTIKVDFENIAEPWWDAAQALAASGKDPTFTRIINALLRSRDDEVGDDVIRGDLDAFHAACARLPGWDDGPTYARWPLIIDP